MVDTPWTFREEPLTDIDAGDFVGSRTVVLAAGPPLYANFAAGTAKIYNWNDGTLTTITTEDELPAIAVIQDLALQQNKPLIQLGEIGSDGKYYIRDRGSNSLRLSRLVFDGPSLLGALYQGTGDAIDPSSAWNAGEAHFNPTGKIGGAKWRKFWLNLDAKIFDRPFGLYYFLTTVQNADTAAEKIGEFYFENCYIDMQGMNLGQGTSVIAEGVTLKWSRINPMDE